MFNPKRQVQFERFAGAQLFDYSKKIMLSYRPAGYWSTDVVVCIDFNKQGCPDETDSMQCEGLNVNFRINYDGGGYDPSQKIDRLIAVENYQLALADALSFVKHVKSRIVDGATFLEVATEILSVDFPNDSIANPEGFIPDDPVVIDIGEDYFVTQGILILGQDTALRWLKMANGEATPFVRLATLQESEYWWFKKDAGLIVAISE